MERAEISNLLGKYPQYQEVLFMRGFLITNDRNIKKDGYPFYENWGEYCFSTYRVLVHKRLKCFINENVCLIGHAYNPFQDEIDENKIVEKIVKQNTFREKLDYIDELTGIFTIAIVEKGALHLIGDCSGMQSCYYGVVKGKVYISTHTQLIGDICSLFENDYTKKMKAYKHWKKYGLFLPGDITQFDEIKRLVPNTYVFFENNEWKIKRFYPTKAIAMVGEENYENRIEEIAVVMKNTMRLIGEKWKNPAISMTGGMDSKGTVAAANGNYDKFTYYSYVSMDGDKIDADAAHKIAEVIGVTHNIYEISREDSDFEDIDVLRAIFEHNYGELGKLNDNDVRKRCYFLNTDKFDVEIKSWVSEVARANYYKKFGKKKMPQKLSNRQMSSMYKFFTTDRKLLRRTDRIFGEYKEKVDFENIFNIDASDMYLWEFRYGSWGGNVITTNHRISYDITIPYNNRKLLELFLSTPLKYRIEDKPHFDVIKMMEPKIDELGITITNWNETKKRMYLEKLYFNLNSLLP